ncbi:MAG: GreA/GreB family elongation factor [Deltaproteobacteria bacterium]|nr:MAG: GreA/GreB family elongation factor [Deltaproteobacteria bacterium]
MQASQKFWIEQLAAQLRGSDAVAQRAEQDAREAARTLATESEKKEDGRASLEFGSLATGQANRARGAQQDLRTLAAFGAGAGPSRDVVALGSIVDVAILREQAPEERTFIVLPVGAGCELQGPGGDGFISVITPASPVGRALMGKRCGDVVDVAVRGDVLEYEVLAIA